MYKDGRLDVQRTGLEVFEDLVDEGMPSRVLREKYDLSPAQWGKVKLVAAKIAADHFMVLGYHQQSNRFRVIRTDSTIAIEIMEYSLLHIGQEGATLAEQARGGAAAGLITDYRKRKLQRSVVVIREECQKGSQGLRKSLKEKS